MKISTTNEFGAGVAAVSPLPRLLGLLLVLATLCAYLPAWQAGFIFDDDAYVTGNLTLRDGPGLARIWAQPTATPQYYPLVYTMFWLEYHLWGLDPVGYHVTNVLLQALAAVLLWHVLEGLRLPGAWLAAAIFAVHPVGVESVAWVTERKNVLSAVFYFSAALVYLRWCGLMARDGDKGETPRSVGRWIFAFALYLAALLSKTTACALPAVLLLVIWWRRGRIAKRDVWPLLPFFLVGAVMAWLTSWLERTNVGASGADWSFSFPEHCLIAGRALWFYAGKLFWPASLIYIYPRWQINERDWWQWLFPVAAVMLVGMLWCLRRRIGRGPLVAVLIFAGTLFPALGFTKVYFMRYSFVADHFQYLASVGLIVLAAGALAKVLNRIPSAMGAAPAAGPLQRSRRGWEAIVGSVLILVLGTLTWRQCGMYVNQEVLWRTTIQRSPGSWMAYCNLGQFLMTQGRSQEAIAEWHKELEIKPDDGETLYNLGMAAYHAGRMAEAAAYFQQALNSEPNLTAACNKLAWVLATAPDPTLRNGPMAVELAEHAVKLSQGMNPDILGTLAAAYANVGRFSDAVFVLQQALKMPAPQMNELMANDLALQLKFYQAHAVFRDLGVTTNAPTQ